MRKSTFDYEPSLLEQEGSQMRINFDVERVTESYPAMDGEDSGTVERQVFKAYVVRVPMPLTADAVRQAVTAQGFDELKAEAVATEVMFVSGGSSDLDQAKAMVIARIALRDSSPAVNDFTIDGQHHWIPREMRDMFQNRLTQEARRGNETVSLDLPDAAEGAVPLTLNVGQAQQMLDVLNDYATDCYDRTQQHKRAVAALTTVDEALAYDYTTGYPEKISFDEMFSNAG